MNLEETREMFKLLDEIQGGIVSILSRLQELEDHQRETEYNQNPEHRLSDIEFQLRMENTRGYQ